MKASPNLAKARGRLTSLQGARLPSPAYRRQRLTQGGRRSRQSAVEACRESPFSEQRMTRTRPLRPHWPLDPRSLSEDYLTAFAGQRQWIATTNCAGCPGQPPGSFANSAALTTSAKVPDALGWLIAPCFLCRLTPKRNSLSRLWPVQISDHSPFTFFSPRSKNCRNPRPCLIWPNTGSTVASARRSAADPAWSVTSVASGPWETDGWVCDLGARVAQPGRGGSAPARRTGPRPERKAR